MRYLESCHVFTAPELLLLSNIAVLLPSLEIEAWEPFEPISLPT